MYCNAVPVTYTIEGSGVNWVSLHEVTGLEVPNRNVAEYAKAIDELLSDDKKRNDSNALSWWTRKPSWRTNL